jgi:anti-anti-sigma factor
MTVVIETREVDRDSAQAFADELELAYTAYCELAHEPSPLVLDLTEVVFMDAGGVQALIELERRVVDRGGRLELYSAGPPPRVLQITGVWDRFHPRSGTAA